MIAGPLYEQTHGASRDSTHCSVCLWRIAAPPTPAAATRL